MLYKLTGSLVGLHELFWAQGYAQPLPRSTVLRKWKWPRNKDTGRRCVWTNILH